MACIVNLVLLQRLKQQTPRQVDLNFEALIRKFSERRGKRDERLAKQM